MKQTIIASASYCYSGSSAVTDLLGEFDDIFYMGDYEFRFVQDPFGISDLEHNLVENVHRHNSGYYLKRYKKNVDFLSGNRFIKKYEQFFDGRFKTISYDYINKLTAFTFKGYWHQDVIDKGYIFYVYERLKTKIVAAIMGPILKKNKSAFTVGNLILDKEITYMPKYNPEEFYRLTREYMDELFTVANKEGKRFIMVDQLLPPTNSKRYLRYFNDIKLIAVDRDPRDLYILEKTKWHGKVIPTPSVEIFCEWYRLTRKHRDWEEDDKERVLRINLEDLIYHYDDTLDRVLFFLKIDKKTHSKPFAYFDPKVSIKNTRLWPQHSELAEDIKYLEENLSEYCYNNY